LKTQFIPRSKQFSSWLQIIFYKAQVTVLSEISTIHINTAWTDCRIF